MRRLAAILAMLALLLLAAHALRRGDVVMCAVLAGLAGLCLTRMAWVRFVVAVVLVVGCLVWLDAGTSMIAVRQAMDAPYLRLLCIMGGVFAFTVLALAVTLGGAGREWYCHARDHGGYLAAIFMLTTGLLIIASAKTPFPLLLVDRFWPGSGFIQIFLLGLYAVWIGWLVREPKGHRRVRPRIWVLFTVVFFGQLALGLSGVDQLLMTGELHLPVPALIVGGPLFRGGGLFMLILYASTVLLVGPAWCSHLCYIGSWDDQASRLRGRKAGVGPSRAWTIWGRATTLALTVAAALGLRAAGVPGLTAIWIAAGFGLASVGVMLVISRRMGVMAHCAAFCPIGLIGNIFGKIAPWRVRMNADCTQCGACMHACRYGAITDKDIERGTPGISCTLCGDCVSGCPHGAMQYGCPGLDGNTARLAFLTLAVSLHAVFLGVARI